MRLRVQLIAVVLLLVVALSCSSNTPESSSDTTWVGTITTEGNVTTVVNELGSVWGGTARLVEELSIGVESGPPEYMFGEISWVHVDDAGIWVADRQTPAVRLFALDGTHVRDIGGEGEGPGEYVRPYQIATTPGGHVFVVDQGTRRINVYGTDGEFLETLPLGGSIAWGGYIPMPIDAAGRPWLVYRDYDMLDPVARRSPSFVVRAYSTDRPTGEPWPVPGGSVIRAQGTRTPFDPAWQWNLTPSGELLMGGSDAYRFERRSREGATLRIEMYGDPVHVSEGEVAYFSRRAALRQTNDGGAIRYPETKPAFLGLLGTVTGEIWVLRQGPGFKVPDCNDHPASIEEMLSGDLCWQDALFFDVFGEDGRYLGGVDVPDEMRYQLRYWARAPHFAGDRVTAVATDEAGTLMVKRYRLVLPGEEER